MNAQYAQFTTFLTKYAEASRIRYEQAETELVTIEFYGNDTLVFAHVEPLESADAIAVDDFWWDGETLRRCVSLSDSGQGFAQSYDVVIPNDQTPAGGQVIFADAFSSTLQLKSEFINLNIPLSDQVVVSEGSKGDLQVNNGDTYMNFPVGADGYTLLADATAAFGVRWSPAGGDEGDITWRGNWGSDIPYRYGDVVRHNDETYISLTTSQDKEPPQTQYWATFVGRGAAGPAGQQGEDGLPGPLGIDWKGDYLAGSYLEGDAVYFSGSSYRANVDTTNEPPHADWDLVAGGAGNAVIRQFLASDVVHVGRIVQTEDSGAIAYADSRMLDHRYRIVGVVVGPGPGPFQPGDSVDVVLSGYATFSGWNHVPPGAPLFLGENGMLMTDPNDPANKTFSVIVGKIVTASEINIDIHNPIQLAL